MTIIPISILLAVIDAMGFVFFLLVTLSVFVWSFSPEIVRSPTEAWGCYLVMRAWFVLVGLRVSATLCWAVMLRHSGLRIALVFSILFCRPSTFSIGLRREPVLISSR